MVQADPDRDLALLHSLFFLHPGLHFAGRNHRRIRIEERAQRAVADGLDYPSPALVNDVLKTFR